MVFEQKLLYLHVAHCRRMHYLWSLFDIKFFEYDNSYLSCKLSQDDLEFEVHVLTPNLKAVSKFLSPIKVWSFNLIANADADASMRSINSFTEDA